MYLQLATDITEFDGDREVCVLIHTDDRQPQRVCFLADYYTHEKFTALYKKGRKCHGKALSILKREARRVE